MSEAKIIVDNSRWILFDSVKHFFVIHFPTGIEIDLPSKSWISQKTENTKNLENHSKSTYIL